LKGTEVRELPVEIRAWQGDAGGESIGLALWDLSEQHRLSRAQKDAALTELLQGLSHQMKDHLAVILARSQLAQQGAQEPVLRQDLVAIEQAARAGTEELDRLLPSAHPHLAEDGEFAPLDLCGLAQEVVEATRPEWWEKPQAQGHQVTVLTDLQPVPLVRGDVRGLKQALAELITNAVKALPEGGTIRLEVYPEARSVILRVSDTGTGMTQETSDRAFDPFFTTKGPGHRGLGLTLVQAVVLRHRGEISLDTAPGRGSTFTLRFPRLISS
jgi:signal transduction histidine kinase